MKKYFLNTLLVCMIFVLFGCSFDREEEVIKSGSGGILVKENGRNIVVKLDKQIFNMTGSEVLEEDIVEPQSYESKELGIKFTRTYSDNLVVLVEKDNIIASFYLPQYLLRDVDDDSIEIANQVVKRMLSSYVSTEVLKEQEYLEVFTKDADEDIEESINQIIRDTGKNPQNCKIVEKVNDVYNDDHRRFKIELAEPIVYAEEEKQKIQEAEQNLSNDPFATSEAIKQNIYHARSIELCSEYAESLHVATCKSIAGYFEYNTNSKTKFVFFPSQYCDMPFYEWDSLEFLTDTTTESENNISQNKVDKNLKITPIKKARINYQCGEFALYHEKEAIDCETNGQDFLMQYEYLETSPNTPSLVREYPMPWRQVFVKKIGNINVVFEGKLKGVSAFNSLDLYVNHYKFLLRNGLIDDVHLTKEEEGNLDLLKVKLKSEFGKMRHIVDSVEYLHALQKESINIKNEEEWKEIVESFQVKDAGASY